MKRLYLLCILLSALVSCDKQPFDYRNKYIGYYEFTVEVTSHDIPTGAEYTYTEPYTGKVSYGSRSNTIYLRFLYDVTLEPTLDDDGQMTLSDAFDGNFPSRKKVHFTYRDGGYPEKRYVVTGVKQ